MITTATNIALKIKQKTDVKNIVVYEQEEKKEVFENVKYIDAASADIDKKIMEHPKEDGTLIVDHVVNDPNQVHLTVLIDDTDTSSLNEIIDYYSNSKPLIVKVKNETFSNMIISSRPIKVDSEHYDASLYDLTFKEVQIAVTQYVKMSVPQVKNQKNASTVKVGQKQPQKQKQQSILSKIKNKFGL